MRIAGWVVIGGLMVGCGGGGGGPDAGAAADAGDPDADPFCHYDCSAVVSCRDGVVRRTASVPVPCEQWTGECPAETHACTAGCDLEFGERFGADATIPLQAYCAETPAAIAGDDCVPWIPCLPTRADASAVQDYLACVQDTCVLTEGPSYEGYLSPCPDEAAGIPDGETALVHRFTPPDLLCLVAWDAGAGEHRHGTTVECTGDWECPEGSTCDDLFALTGPTICRPGPRDAPLAPYLPPP